MANIIYNKFFEQVTNGSADLDAAGLVVRCLLERDTSTYTPNKDHDFRGDLTGLVEITVASYLKQTVTAKAITINDTDDRVDWDFADIDFSTLETGQTVEALIFYIQVGGDDATPATDPLVARIDTATGLPAVLGGGNFSVVIAATGFMHFQQA